MWSLRLGSENKSTHGNDAEAAIQRAQAQLDEVRERRPEVTWLHDQIASRRLKNNFGPSLELAIERKSAGLD